MKFRADIQILRGLSVIFVVLFHLGFSLIQSGFLGVDVFFVISGFLMAVLYKSQNKINFFQRRAVRLLPAYYAVILFTLFVSFIVNTPNETNQVVSQALYGATFSSNIGFWSQNSYFSKAEFNPLLHLWSLGVEIQFYCIVPLLALLFSRNKSFLIILLLGSLFSCFFITTISPKTSFFMMPLRMWEFLIGYGSAFFLTKKGDIVFSNFKWLGVIGLIFIACIPIIKVDGQSLSMVSGHPGLPALLISVSTGLVLVFGLPNAFEGSIFGRVLALLGKYSYSIYLVHFPIIVLYLSSPFAGTVLNPSSTSDFIALFLLISLASILMHRHIEIRKFNINIFSISIAASALIFLLVFILPFVQGNIFSPEEMRIFNAFHDRSAYRCGKLSRILNPGSISCELTGLEGGAKRKIMLVGNSHADSIKTTFAKIAKENNTALYFIAQNTPLMKGGLMPRDIVNEAVKNKINLIVLHFSPAGFEYDSINELVTLSDVAKINVIFIDPVPVWTEHIPQMMYRNISAKKSDVLQTKNDYLIKNSELLDELNKSSSDNFKHISIVDRFCKPVCVYKTIDGFPLYFDSNHLTLTGSLILEDVFVGVVNELVASNN